MYKPVIIDFLGIWPRFSTKFESNFREFFWTIIRQRGDIPVYARTHNAIFHDKSPVVSEHCTIALYNYRKTITNVSERSDVLFQ